MPKHLLLCYRSRRYRAVLAMTPDHSYFHDPPPGNIVGWRSYRYQYRV